MIPFGPTRAYIVAGLIGGVSGVGMVALILTLWAAVRQRFWERLRD